MNRIRFSDKEGSRKMQLYQFERIYSQMEKEFGKIRKGDEESYMLVLLALEGNVLRVHRMYPDSDSRRLKEAIALVLFDIRNRYSEEKYDAGNFRNEQNERLEKALLMAFDPLSNKEIEEVLREEAATDVAQLNLYEYYKIPVMCLLRIKESVDTWEKRMGVNGYFLFTEQCIGEQVEGNEMKFAIMPWQI